MLDFKTIFRALQNRNYRLFFYGQSISLIGTWMQQVAVSWLVYRLTHSAFLLGFVGFAGQIPAFIFAPFAGVVADRHHRHRLLLITQTSAMIQAFILSVLVLSHTIQIWHIVALSILSGLINAFDIPVRQAFTIEMIEHKEDLSNAIALNSSMVNMARLIGPSIAGVLIALTGEGMCFLLNALSYIAVIASLLLMKVQPHSIPPHKPPVLHHLKEGFRYAFDSIPIRIILLLLGTVSLVAGGFQTVMPVFAGDVFQGGPHTLGFLVGATGLGALSGAIYLAGRKSVVGLGRVIARTSGIFGIGVILFSLSKIFWLSMVLAFFVGFGMMVEMASSNTILQVIVEEDKRGRIMSFYTMAFMGTAPIGSLLVGILAGHLGVTNTLCLTGGCCVVGSVLFTKSLPILKETIHPIYRKKGIIPEVAQGLQSTTGNLPK